MLLRNPIGSKKAGLAPAFFECIGAYCSDNTKPAYLLIRYPKNRNSLEMKEMSDAAEANAAPTSTGTIQLILGTSVARSITDDAWEITSPIYIECWKNAAAFLSKRAFLHNQEQVELEVDLHPAIVRLQQHYELLREFYALQGSEKSFEVLNRYPRQSVELEFVANLHGNHSYPENYASKFVENFLNDFFLVMNLSAPAACNFYSAKLKHRHSYTPIDIDLSNYFFEAAFLLSHERGGPKIHFLPLQDVSKWFFSVRSDLKMVPQNRMEKVLFALLHIAKIGVSPTTVVWLFYALETLFDTKAGENFRALISRISLLLTLNNSDMKILKKEMRELYDIRSAFVHGGLDVVHPLHDETLDSSVDQSYRRLMKATEFGFQVVVASLQEIIRRGWREPVFKEMLCGSEKHQLE